MTQRRYRDLATLVKDLRKGDGSAAAEFTRRFTPLLRRSAGRLHVDRGDRSDVIGSVLSDVMLHLIHCGSAIPENLGAYAVVALRNRLLMELRGRARAVVAAEMPLEDAMEELDSARVRSFLDTGGKTPAVSVTAAAVHQLWTVVLRDLTESDRVLLGYLLEQLPPREVAESLSITHSAAKVRMHRLRKRLRDRFLEAMALLPSDESAAVERVLRRAGVRVSAPPLHPGTVPRDVRFIEGMEG